MEQLAYIFDFDGTLVDSMPFWSQKVLNILKETDTPYPVDIIKTVATLGDVGTANYIRDVLGVKLGLDEIMTRMEEYAIPKYSDEIVLKEGVRTYLEDLKKKNRSLSVLTASPHKMVDVCLKRNGIFEMFDNVWSTDDFGMSKTETEIYLNAVRKIGVNVGQAAFFDDNINAVKTAKLAGLYTVGVFDETAMDFGMEMKETANLYIMSFCELNAKYRDVDKKMLKRGNAIL